MADLMTDVYDYDTLANKYGNFYRPTVKIFVNNQSSDVLSSMDLEVEEVKVDLSLTAAGSTQFKISNAYETEKHQFKSDVKDKFKPGTIVEIALGYGSSVIKIQKGFVCMLGADCGAKNLLVVTVMDVRRLMMSSGSKHLLHDVKNYSDAFENVMAPYAKLCSLEISTTDDKLESPISQTGTDYDFVMEELIKKGKSNREFFIVGDKAYFRERPKQSSSMMKIEMGRELLHLEMDYSYLDVEIQVMGYNSYEQQTYTGTAKAKSSEPQASLISTPPVWIISDPDADNQEKAAKRAAYLAGNETENAKSGKLVTIGLPEIIPGRFIEVVEVEPMVNKKYYISEVRHYLQRDSMYTTEIEIEGWC